MAVDFTRIRHRLRWRLRLFSRVTAASARVVWRKLKKGDILVFSSALAFSILLTMVPMLLLSASAVGIALSSSDMAVTQLNAVLDTIFPPQPFSASIKESILHVVSDLIQYRTSIGLIGVAVLLVTASFVFDIVRTILHKIYGLRRRKNVLVSFLHDLGFVFVAFVLLFSTNMVLWVVSWVQHAVEAVPAAADLMALDVVQAIPTTIVFVVTALMFFIIYGYITDVRPPRTAAIVSTVTTTVLWVVSGRVFSLYLSSFSAIGTIYGPYAFLLVLLLWVYYSCLVFILGGMVGQAYWETLHSYTKEEITG